MPIFGDLRPDGRRRRRRNEAGGRLAGPLPSQRQHRAASSVGGRGATTARPAASAATLGQRTRTHLTNRRQLTAQLGAAPFQGGNLFIGHARNPPSTQHPYCWNRPNSPCATPPTAIPPQKSDVHPCVAGARHHCWMASGGLRGSSLPEVLEAAAEDAAAQGEDGVGAGDGPTHAGALEPGAEPPASGLDDARGDAQAPGAELRMAHPVSVPNTWWMHLRASGVASARVRSAVTRARSRPASNSACPALPRHRPSQMLLGMQVRCCLA